MTQLRLAKSQKLLRLLGKDLPNELTKIKMKMGLHKIENVTKQLSLVRANSLWTQRKMHLRNQIETAKTNQLNMFHTNLKELINQNIKSTCLLNGDSLELKST
jgi:hypothetical protein